MKPNRVVVIGAGAVGGTIAALLSDAGFPVSIVARGEHGATIHEHGMILRLPDRTLSVHPPCFQMVEQVDWQENDIVLVAVKLQDAQSVLDQLVKCVGPQIPVICASNGIHGERWACERFDAVLSMLVWMAASHLRAGEVSLFSYGCYGVLDIGPVTNQRETALPEQDMCTLGNSVCEQLRRSGFDSVFRQDIQSWKYAKWITNMGNTAQALVTDDWQRVAEAARQEGRQVLANAGLLTVTTKQLLDRCKNVQLVNIDGHSRGGGSTWQSHKRGTPMESPWIEGALADLADQLGVPAPINRQLSELSKNPKPVVAADLPGVRPSK